MIVANARTLSARTTGVQRYALELLRRFGASVTRISPMCSLHGVRGHLWEQAILPALVRKRLLWSPAGTGPLAIGRQVITIHDMAPLDHPEWFNPKFAAWYGWLLPRIIRRVLHVIVVSQFTKDRVMQIPGVCEDNVSVVPNGRDGCFTPRTDQEIRSTRQLLKIPPGPYLLCVGSLEPRKNLRRLLLAWWRVQDVLDKDMWLVITGAVGKKRVFREVSLDRLPPRVLLTGYVADEHLPALYSGAVAAICPSMYEGFGLPALEAMACGTPPIVADTAALLETAGYAGITVNPHDVDAIADGIRRMASDESLRHQLAFRSLARAEQFSWDRTAKATLDILERMDRQ